MLDKNISVEGDDNIIVSNVKDSTINISLSGDELKAIKGLYDIIVNEITVVDTYVVCILNRGGISWYGVGKNRVELYESVESVNKYINQNRFFFSDDFYVEVTHYYTLAKELRSALDCLVEAIATADNQDAITNIYNITYEQDIHCCASFVREMMNAFSKADNHPAYNAFAEVYEQHELQREKILAAINNKRETAI